MSTFAYLRNYSVSIPQGAEKPYLHAEYELLSPGIYNPGVAKLSVSLPLGDQTARTADEAIELIQKALPDVKLVRKDKADVG